MPNEINFQTTEVSKKIENKKEYTVQELLSQLENEFNPENPRILNLREQLLHPTNQNDTEFIKGWKNEYENIAKHKSPEENTERTRYIEQIIKDTLSKAGKSHIADKVRVVILNRGDVFNAFAGPDYTIFLTQKLLTSLQDIDLIMGVVFHELSHIENEDYAVKHRSFSELRFVQEPAADLKLTTNYLDLGGFNTLGLDKAIKKLEQESDGTGKSAIYMEYAQRSMGIKTQHFVEHFRNSTIPVTKAPEILLTNFTLTNLEILQELKKDKYTLTTEEKTILISNLSKGELSNLTNNSFEKFHKELFILISERLKEINFTDDQINYYLFCTEPLEGPAENKFIKTPQQLLDISTNLSVLEGITWNENIKKGDNHLFETNRFLAPHFLFHIKSYMVNENDTLFKDKNLGIPVNDDILIDVLKNYYDYAINAADILDKVVAKNNCIDSINSIINKYVTCYVDNNDLDKLREFFIKVRDSGLPYQAKEETIKWFKSSSAIKKKIGNYTSDITSLNSKNLEVIYREVFNLPEKEEKEERVFLSLDLVRKELREILNAKPGERNALFNNLLLNVEDMFNDMSLLDLLIMQGKISEEDYKKISSQSKNKYDEEYFSNELIKERNLFTETELKEFNLKRRQNNDLRIPYIEAILQEIDNFPSDTREFYDPTGKFPRNAMVKEYYFFNVDERELKLPDPILTPEYLKEAKAFSTFNLKLVTLLKLSQKDEDYFYEKINDMMQNSHIKFESMTSTQMLKLLSPLINIDSFGVPTVTSTSGFGLAYYTNRIHFRGYGENPDITGVVIENIDKLENLPFIQDFINKQQVEIGKITNPSDITKHFEALKNEYVKYFKDFYPHHDTDGPFNPYEDRLSVNVILRNLRKSFLEMIETLEPNQTDLQELYKVCKTVLPNNIRTDEICRNIRTSFLESDADFSEKVKFFKEFSEDCDYDDLLFLVEQIKGDRNNPGKFWEDWKLVHNTLGEIVEQYLSGKKSSRKLIAADFLASNLNKVVDIISTTDYGKVTSEEHTNKLALKWLESVTIKGHSILDRYFEEKDKEWFNRKKNGMLRLNKEKNRVSVSAEAREYFYSLKDLIKLLKSFGNYEKMYLINKSLVSEGGYLLNDENREKLSIIVKKSLELNDPFMSDFAHSLIMEAQKGTDERDYFLMVASNALAPNLFGSLGIENLNYDSLLEEYNKRAHALDKIPNIEILKNLLESDTKNISASGFQYYHPNSKIISPLFTESEEDYEKTLKLLESKFKREVVNEELEDSEDLIIARNLEILFKGAENTILGTRAIQLLRQMMRFKDKNLDLRMARSFDANPGLDRLRFFMALNSATKYDAGLEDFLKNKLIDIVRRDDKRDNLGGGSMATTYKAEILDDKNDIIPAAIRALVPGADMQVEGFSKLLIRSLDRMVDTPRRKDETEKEYEEKMRYTYLARTIVQLATNWCISDITDNVYEERDDIFREQSIEMYNNWKKNNNFVAPDRIYTSFGNFVRVEGLAGGITLRAFLDDENISSELKSEVVKQVILFNRFQYADKNLPNDLTQLVQSDPSIGNYLVEIVEGKPIIHVLDRGLMLPVSETRIEMFNSLFNKQYSKFFSMFLDEILEYNLEKNPTYEFLKYSNNFLRYEVKNKIIETVVPKVVYNKFFEGGNMNNLVKIVNDALVDQKLITPWDLQLLIKNIVGLEVLRDNYVKNK